MGGFIFGYDTGQISGILEMKPFIERFGNGPPGQKAFSDVRSGLVVGLVSCTPPSFSVSSRFSILTAAQLSIGTLIGALIAAPIANKVGRKWSISGWCVILFVGIIIQCTAAVHKWYQVMMGRFVAGLSVGSLSLLVPLYQGETAPRQIRGSMVW